MPAFFQNGVLNEGNTPAAKTGTLAARAAATAVSEGTIYIAYDTQEIFSAQGGNWVKVSGGGGGGSQNLDQVLAVGDTATNKNITLNGTNNSIINVIRNGISGSAVAPLGNNTTVNGGSIQGSIDSNFDQINNQVIQSLISYPNGGSTTQKTEFYYTANNNGKNTFYIKKINNSVNNFRRFLVNASYVDGNTVQLTEKTGTQISEILQEANNITFQSKIKLSISDSNAGLSKYTEINESGFIFEDLQNGNYLTYVTPSFTNKNLQIFFPEFDGVMANINEYVRGVNIDLSIGNYDCANYGVYQISVGDNTRVFDLTNFVTNGIDGQFVTICAGDVPVKCLNSAGNIFGTANINSKGLFKLMKINNDIYSSHI